MKLHKVALGAVAACALAATATSVWAGGLKDREYGSSSIWTGAYWGVHLGGGASNIDWLFTPVNNTRADHSGDGVVGGVHLGYNWQLSSLVLGIEGSATLSGINGDRLCPDETFRCEHENRLSRLRAWPSWCRRRVSTFLRNGWSGLPEGGLHD